MLLQNIVKEILKEGNARNLDLIDDPLKHGNVFIFHGTRSSVDIIKHGIIAFESGVINKSGIELYMLHPIQ